MDKNISNIRKDFVGAPLDINNLAKNPLEQFNTWLDEAIAAVVEEPTAFTLATSNKQGIPAARVVLLKHVQQGKLIFFTNYSSAKAKDLEENPVACANFCWLGLHRQVRIVGSISKVADELSDEYFYSRPFASRAAAACSAQSKPVESREALEKKYQDFLNLPEDELKRPSNWGGYAIKPESFEFWQGRPSRLHDRFKYSLENGLWKIERLQP